MKLSFVLELRKLCKVVTVLDLLVVPDINHNNFLTEFGNTEKYRYYRLLKINLDLQIKKFIKTNNKCLETVEPKNGPVDI